MTRPLSARRAREIIDGAALTKAPDHRETRHWHVVSGGEVLVVVEPSYRAVSGRKRWRWRLADSITLSAQEEPTIEKAAVAGLGAWQRWITRKENP
ncbi:hypothetical protein ACFY2M_19270 [Streptomyces sp. NPDC001276]|uniref:hypothetical protein n=1 Tax=Streptomyces sp. NPDC001276 TaxID=3364555 RepID=UPI0036853394